MNEWISKSRLPLVALLAAVGCGTGTEVPPAVDVTFATTPIQFEPVLPGHSASKVLLLTNEGTDGAQVSLKLSDSEAPFELSTSLLGLRAGESAEVTIRFVPENAGQFDAELAVAAGEKLLGTVPLSGTAHDARCTVDAESIDLGAVMVGASREHELQVSNSGEVAFGFGATLVQEEGSGLELESISAMVIEPGAQETVRIAFRPKSTGQAHATLQIRAPSCERDIEVSATAVEAVVSATELDFGYVHPGKRVTRHLLLENAGREEVAVSLKVGSGAEFELEQTTVTLPGEGQVQVPVTFAPSSLGELTAKLFATLDHPQQHLEIAVRGWGGGPDIDVQKRLEFATVAVDSWALQRLQVRNIGSDVSGTTLDNLVLGDSENPVAVIENDSAGAFELLPPDATLSTTGLEAGTATVFQIRFQPTAPGLHSATLTIFSNDPERPTSVVELKGEAATLPDCSWEILFPSLEFGDVLPATGSFRHLQVRNVGSTECHVGAPQIFGSEAFSLVSAASGASIIAPGDSMELKVRFAPLEIGSHSASLVLYTSSRTSPEIAVPLSGRGWNTCLQLLPVIDIGEAAQGCAATRSVDLYNACAASITLTDSRVAGAGFTVATPTLPATIPANGTLRLDARFQPAASGEAHGEIQLVADDGETIVAELRAAGAADLSRRDLITGTTDQVDVLLIGDDGSGVPNNLTIPLGEHAATFFAPATAAGIDFHVAVTTTSIDFNGSRFPNGRFLPASKPSERVLTAGTPNLFEVFARNLDIGDGGSATETPLESFWMALSPENLAGHNAGFLRPDARLHVVFLTNAEDQSSREVSFYEDFAAQLVATGRTKRVTFSGIIPTPEGPTPSCSYDSWSAAFPARMRELIARTGGYLREYCQAVSNIPGTTVALAEHLFRPGLEFPLRSEVDPSAPIVVRVNGQIIPELDGVGGPNWTVDAARRTLHLSPSHAIGVGDTLEIEYLGICQP